MSLQNLNSPPKADDFTPLSEHQQQTPASFFGAKPVLHAHYEAMTLSVAADQLQQDAAFSKFNSRREGEEDLVDGVDVWVSSENLILFQNTPSPVGVSIPYPSLALHATMKYKSTIEALYMNISLNDAETVNEDDDIRMLEITVLPPSYATKPTDTCISEFFAALNTCADLHPDPDASDDEGDDMLDDTAPGASGWITADNMDEYLDEDGNFKGMVVGEELGPGAGTVRTREEADDGSNGVNGADGHEEKYHRTG
ncbi:regulator of volume decrease after cellular swelling-domain-containing protein [Bipolaris maydis]|uniref:regulator of volume decrease after cellular swelling-domain-containing protein n=1 Tax=Cochliobolus heterostrophus TaxID=5016 RepID=UPI0024D3E022|nr:regulator of volume decrease after cellular swelling-domain-containing protein [Bipolaris maydis]KAJ5060869.1 regulator of volume decrease after cellular swelling-domain-containing protein [Bipolaris maydis]KAJ6198005.1 regulator of volume decrease after cellular swelling-domain-containing protein [Bipolaris maydis]KAJ6210135.1 regulator of volume decrease after cellular swelling-domain-containing protein [Bipolaris maydis]KAJ6272322.1 regulator of volume decrease after cellular swelling-dom